MLKKDKKYPSFQLPLPSFESTCSLIMKENEWGDYHADMRSYMGGLVPRGPEDHCMKPCIASDWPAIKHRGAGKPCLPVGLIADKVRGVEVSPREQEWHRYRSWWQTRVPLLLPRVFGKGFKEQFCHKLKFASIYTVLLHLWNTK